MASLVRQDLLDDAEWEAAQLAVQSPNTTLSQLRAATPLLKTTSLNPSSTSCVRLACRNGDHGGPRVQAYGGIRDSGG